MYICQSQPLPLGAFGISVDTAKIIYFFKKLFKRVRKMMVKRKNSVSQSNDFPI